MKILNGGNDAYFQSGLDFVERYDTLHDSLMWKAFKAQSYPQLWYVYRDVECCIYFISDLQDGKQPFTYKQRLRYVCEDIQENVKKHEQLHDSASLHYLKAALKEGLDLVQLIETALNKIERLDIHLREKE